MNPLRFASEVSGIGRTLHFQLIAIVVTTVVVVLTVSQAVDTHLTERALEQDLSERAHLVLRIVDSLWTDTEPAELRDRLQMIAAGDREVRAIDVFRLQGTTAEIDVSTREPEQLVGITPSAAELARLINERNVTSTLPDRGEADVWRLSAPLMRGGAVQGVAQVELRTGEVLHLKHRLRAIDGVVLLCSTVLISLALTVFLGRRVAGPVAALVDGMRRVEHGDLRARVRPVAGGEFGFLTHSFNTMLARLEALTTDLGEQVRRATQNLAEKNRELQAANEKLWQAQLELGRGERLAALGQMAGTLAHELGTPLNSVLGYVQLLRHDALRAEDAEKLHLVESQVQRMIETMRSVLDHTRDVPLQRTPINLSALVADAIALVSPRLSNGRPAITADIPPSLPTVPGDAVGLRQVLLNLLANAIDATGAPGTITVSAAVVPPQEGCRPQLELAVHDTGHGMSSEELQRAFEPFYTTKGPGRGTGLGLVIVEHIVRAHGGQLLAESTPGRGTTMRVRLPLAT